MTRHVACVLAVVITVNLGAVRTCKAERGLLLGTAATHLAGYMVDRFLLDPLFDSLTGQPDVPRIQRQLTYIERKDPQHAEEIRRLREAIDDKMTREDVEALIGDAPNRIDAELASQVRQIQEQRQLLEVHQAILTAVRSDIEFLAIGQRRLEEEIGSVQRQVEELGEEVAEEFSSQGRRLTAAEQELERIKRDYPRWTHKQQSSVLGAAAMELIENDDADEAVRAFRAAHGYDPSDPGHLFGLGLAYYRLGKEEIAMQSVARGIALERKRTLEDWYSRKIERVQGAQRVWLETQRFDPVYGVFVPGLVQVPTTLIERDTP